MQLTLKDSNIAATFGVPQRDCDSDEVIKLLQEQGNTTPQNHLACAIAAGAYDMQLKVYSKAVANKRLTDSVEEKK